MYVFLHIPKTAGTTFETILTKNFREDYVPLYASTCHDYFNEAEIEAIATLFTEAKCVSSHDLAGPLPKPTRVDVQFKPLTFLREPVDRILSFYHYVGNDPRHFGSLPFEEYFRKTKERDLERSNGAFSHVANAQAYVLDRNLDEQEILRQLDDLFFIGITKRFDESLVVLKQKMERDGVPFDIHYVSKKVRGRLSARKNLPQEIYDEVMEHNRLDKVAYDRANEILDSEIESYDGDFEADLNQFREIQKKRVPIAKTAEFLQKVTRVQQRTISKLFSKYV